MNWATKNPESEISPIVNRRISRRNSRCCCSNAEPIHAIWIGVEVVDLRRISRDVSWITKRLRISSITRFGGRISAMKFWLESLHIRASMIFGVSPQDVEKPPKLDATSSPQSSHLEGI